MTEQSYKAEILKDLYLCDDCAPALSNHDGKRDLNKDVEVFISLIRLNEHDDIAAEIMNHYITSKSNMFRFTKEFKKQLENYMYMITFTMKKNIKQKFKDKAYPYIQKLILNHPDVSRAEIATEHCKDGSLHWHVACESTRSMKKCYFNKYIKNYGFVDLSRNKTDNYSTMITYISKESVPIKIKSL